jgi:hypothetical protein
MNKIYFVVEMLRNGDREQHSYVIGVFDDELLALKEAWGHMRYRAMKYGACVHGYQLNGGQEVYRRDLDDWDAFAESCKDLAAAIKPMLDAEEGL